MLLLAAGVLVVLLILRDAGAIELNLNSTVTSLESRSEWRDDARFSKPQSWSVRVQFGDEKDAKVSNVVRAAPPSPSADLLVQVEPLVIDGCTWRPLYKSCSCAFRAKVQRDGLDWGSLEGTLQVSVKGFAPARIIRETVCEQIRKFATNTVRSWVKH